jgi:3-polyprenyl-4-hydroxybenzoate decarboxylase
MERVQDKMRSLRKLSELGSFFPKRLKWGLVQEAAETDNMSLSALSLIKCSPQDGGILAKGLLSTLRVGRRSMDTRNATLARSRHG